MTLSLWLREAARSLHEAGRDAPRLTAELLAGNVLGLARIELLLAADRLLLPAERQELDALLARRRAGEPLAYILGTREFYGRDFAVSPATLVPRPETEHLVDAVLRRVPADRAVRFADCGTGSGCIALTLAAERPVWSGLAVDCSAEALRVARNNAARHGVCDRVRFVRANMHLPLFRPESLDVLVSNPPYVSREDYEQTATEVRHEPANALMPLDLASSPTGLESLERLVAAAWVCLLPGGWLALEYGSDQAEAVRLCLLRNKWDSIGQECDLAGLDRLVCARKPVS